MRSDTISNSFLSLAYWTRHFRIHCVVGWRGKLANEASTVSFLFKSIRLTSVDAQLPSSRCKQPCVISNNVNAPNFRIKAKCSIHFDQIFQQVVGVQNNLNIRHNFPLVERLCDFCSIDNQLKWIESIFSILLYFGFKPQLTRFKIIIFKKKRTKNWSTK